MLNTKKLLIILLVILTTGCNGSINSKETEIHNGSSYMDLIDHRVVKNIEDLGGDLNDENIQLLGLKLSDIVLKDLDGFDYKLPESGPYIVEVVNSSCRHCEDLILEVADKLDKDNINIYQIFINSDKDDVLNFYTFLKTDIKDNTKPLLSSSSFDKFLSDYAIEVTPLSFFIDEEGLIALSHKGYIKYSRYKKLYEYSIYLRLYNIDVSGISLKEYINNNTFAD